MGSFRHPVSRKKGDCRCCARECCRKPYKRIGRDFDPSLGFVPRRAVGLFNGQANNRIRLSSGPLLQLPHEFQPFVATDLSGRWESYRIFTAPINWRFRSGDRVEFKLGRLTSMNAVTM